MFSIKYMMTLLFLEGTVVILIYEGGLGNFDCPNTFFEGPLNQFEP